MSTIISPIIATGAEIVNTQEDNVSASFDWDYFLEDKKEDNFNGWYFLRADGNTYYFLDGDLQKDKFINENEIINYVNKNGKRVVGWTQITSNGITNWYHFNSSKLEGMSKGWFKDGIVKSSKWYYFNEDGTMAHDTIVDGCKLGSDGAWIR